MNGRLAAARMWPLALPVAASVVALLVHGSAGLPGIAAGVLAGMLVVRSPAPTWVGALAASIPPLTATGEMGFVVVGALGLALVVRGTHRPEVAIVAVAFPFAGTLLPPVPAILLAALGAGVLAAVAPRWWALAGGAGLALAAAAVQGGLPIAVLLALAGGASARWVYSHPANLTMARRLTLAGLVLLPLPAALAFLVAALRGNSEHVLVILGAVGGIVLAGGLLLAAHFGAAVLLRSDADVTLPLGLLWSGLGAFVGIAFQSGFSMALAAPAFPLAMAAPLAAVGMARAARRIRGWHAADSHGRPARVKATVNEKY